MIGCDLIGTLGNRLLFLWTNWNVTLLGGSAVHTACQSPLMVVLGRACGDKYVNASSFFSFFLLGSNRSYGLAWMLPISDCCEHG